MLDDIRDTSPELYWEQLRQRWGALLTYRYLGRAFSSMNTDSDDTVVLRSDMRNARGGVLGSVLSCFAPGGASPSDLEMVPNPVIHSIQILDDCRGVQRVAIDGHTLKVGSRMYFGRAVITDADDPTRTIALVDGQGASLGDVPPGMARFDDEAVMQIEDSPGLPPLWQVFGGQHRPDGSWGLGELRPELASPDAALHVGPQFVIHETAAIDLAAEAAGTDQLQTLSMQVMFLARGKAGPFRVEGTVMRGRTADGRIGVHLLLLDEGNDDRAVSSASFMFSSAHP